MDAKVVDQERTILREAALKEGKPESIVDKMVDGRLRSYFAERVLTEQPFVKDDKLTVGKYAEQSGLKLVKFIHWELGLLSHPSQAARTKPVRDAEHHDR